MAEAVRSWGKLNPRDLDAALCATDRGRWGALHYALLWANLSEKRRLTADVSPVYASLFALEPEL